MKIAVLAAMALSSAPEHPDGAWRCEPTAATVCSGSTCGAGNLQTGTWLLLDPVGRNYYRCPFPDRNDGDLGACDRYRVSSTETAGFVTFELAGRAGFARIDNDLNFIEIVTLGLQTIRYYGRCENWPSPVASN